MSNVVPAGRGRWLVSLHRRIFTNDQTAVPANTMIAQIPDARSRRLDRQWNQSATFSFTLSGRSESARLITEMVHDVVAWRWDEVSGRDVPMFRGIIAQSQDTLSEQEHTVTFTAHDYLAVLDRRYLPVSITSTQIDQDAIVSDLVFRASAGMQSGSGTGFNPGSYLPITVTRVNPDGSARPATSGQLRDRTYTAGAAIGPLINDLAYVINGFDYDLVNQSSALDQLRIFYPAQGIARSDPLVYGSNVASLTRSVDTANYANFWRVIGNAGDPNAPQLYAEAWSPDANNVGVSPQGLWQSIDNQADVSVLTTLQEKAAGNLAQSSVLIPSYSLSLRPGWYTYTSLNMGDTFTLIVRSGRLDIQVPVRVLGISFDIGDDGEEDVLLTVGRPAQTLIDALVTNNRTVQALARR